MAGNLLSLIMIVVRRDIVERQLSQMAGNAGLVALRKSYQAWLAIVSAAQWRSPIDVKQSHPKASILRSGRVVFNIKANDYRLVAQINYLASTVEIRFFGDHAEYDRVDAQSI